MTEEVGTGGVDPAPPGHRLAGHHPREECQQSQEQPSAASHRGRPRPHVHPVRGTQPAERARGATPIRLVAAVAAQSAARHRRPPRARPQQTRRTRPGTPAGRADQPPAARFPAGPTSTAATIRPRTASSGASAKRLSPRDEGRRHDRRPRPTPSTGSRFHDPAPVRTRGTIAGPRVRSRPGCRTASRGHVARASIELRCSLGG